MNPWGRCTAIVLISFPTFPQFALLYPSWLAQFRLACCCVHPVFQKMRRTECIISQWGETESWEIYLLFTNDIKSGKGKSVSCEIADHPGLSCFYSLRKSHRDCKRGAIKENLMGRYFGSACVPCLIACPLPLMKAGTKIVIGPHGCSELYLQGNSGET